MDEQVVTPEVVTDTSKEAEAEKSEKEVAFAQLKEAITKDPIKAKQYLQMLRVLGTKARITANQIRHLGPIHENQCFCRKKCPFFKEKECWKKTAAEQTECIKKYKDAIPNFESLTKVEIREKISKLEANQ